MAGPRIVPIVGKRVIPPAGATTRELRKEMEKVVADGVRYASDYPPAPAGSSYVRTRTLGRSWDRKVTQPGGTVLGVVFSNRNIAPYNVWVQGPTQTSYHAQTGWRTIEDIADFMAGIIEKRLPGAIIRPFRG